MQPPEGESPIISFDKDDDDTLDFVAASANIRSHIFDIEKKSKFEIKRKCQSTPQYVSNSIRNGWEYHSCHCYYKRNDGCTLRFAGI